MKTSQFLGVGYSVPSKIWKNDDLKTLMDTSDEWIHQRTGIKQRHWVDHDSAISSSDLALEATQNALKDAGMAKEEIDMIIFATLSPDHEFPGTGCFFQAKLGVPGIPAIDIRQQCTGFIYGMSIADQFVKTGAAKRVLVVGSEVHSKGLDKSTRGRDVSVLFGDGAGAAIIGEADVSSNGTGAPSQIIGCKLHADGRFAKELWTEAPRIARKGDRYQADDFQEMRHFPQMNGRVVFTHAVKRMPEVLQEVLAENRIGLDEIDLFVFHQANLRINEAVAKQLGIPEHKIFNTIDRFANTTAATIPIGLAVAQLEGRLKKGMLVASAAFGSGFTWAAAVYRW